MGLREVLQCLSKPFTSISNLVVAEVEDCELRAVSECLSEHGSDSISSLVAVEDELLELRRVPQCLS